MFLFTALNLLFVFISLSGYSLLGQSPAVAFAPLTATQSVANGVPSSMLPVIPIDSSQPRLFFTDIESGPNVGGQDNLGAFITIYGEGFGAARGNSQVTIGGYEVAKYVIWGEDNAFARNLDVIVVQLGSNVTSGQIVVTVNGKASNPLPFAVRSGNIYFVIPSAANASDANPGTFVQPFKTLYREAGKVSAGDIVYVKGGTFNTADPRAPGWDCVLCLFPDNDASGTASNPIAYVGYPGDSPVLGAPQPMRRALLIDPAIAYYIIANLRFTNYGGMMELAGNGHRIVGNSFYDGIASYVLGIVGDSAHCRILGNLIRNNGAPGEKMNGVGLYVQGFGTNQDIDVGWNQIQDQHGSRAIQVYGHLDNDRIDNLCIHDNLISGSELNNILLGGSDGATDVLGTVYVYNNIIVDAGDPGLRVNDPQGTVIIQNNVFYNNGSPGFGGSNAQVYIEQAGTGKITFRTTSCTQDPIKPTFSLKPPLALRRSMPATTWSTMPVSAPPGIRVASTQIRSSLTSWRKISASSLAAPRLTRESTAPSVWITSVSRARREKRMTSARMNLLRRVTRRT